MARACAYLDEVADCGGPESREEGGGAFFGDDAAAAREEGLALHSGVDLYARLHDVNRCDSRQRRHKGSMESNARVMPPWVTLAGEGEQDVFAAGCVIGGLRAT